MDLALVKENEKLIKRLQEREQDVVMAAQLGNNLLAEVSRLNNKIASLEAQSLENMLTIKQQSDLLEKNFNINATEPPKTDELTIKSSSTVISKKPIFNNNKETLTLSRSSSSLLDPSIAAEIEDALASRVRTLQSKLSQSESLRLELLDKVGDYEKEYFALKKNYEKRQFNEGKLDEKVWDLEVRLQQSQDKFSDLEMTSNKHQIELRTKNSLILSMTNQIESLKGNESSLIDLHEQVKEKLEMEIKSLKKLIAMLQEDALPTSKKSSVPLPASRTTEQPKVKDFESIPVKLPEIKINEVIKEVAIVAKEQINQEKLDDNNQNSLEIEMLKLSLAESENQVQTYRNTSEIYKLECEELKELLEQAQETIDSQRNQTEWNPDEKNNLSYLKEEQLIDRTGNSSPVSVYMFNDAHIQTEHSDELVSEIERISAPLLERDLMHLDKNKRISHDSANPFLEKDCSLAVRLAESNGDPNIRIVVDRGCQTIASAIEKPILSENVNKIENGIGEIIKTYKIKKSPVKNATPVLQPENTLATLVAGSKSSLSFSDSAIASEFGNYNKKTTPVEALTHTMIGSWFQKYNRNGKNPKLRFFWVNPYSRTLNWAPKPPSQDKKGNSHSKCAYIDNLIWNSLESNHKIYPPGPDHSIKIETDTRVINIIPTSWPDYENWISGLSLLLKKSENQPQVKKFVNGGNMIITSSTPTKVNSVFRPVFHTGEKISQGIGLEFLDEVKKRGNGNITPPPL